jgi:cytochrome c oxidase subunit 2
LGIYFGQCDELCGYLHSFMWFRVDVVTPAQYAKWVATFNTVAGAKAAEAAALATKEGTSSVVPTNPTGSSGL